MLNFVREANEGLKDQPSFALWMSAQGRNTFGAVIGDHVFHSYSPYFHSEFFNQKNSDFFAIPMTQEECTEENLASLSKIGLWALAVTSPLKNTPVVQSSGPMNTLLKGKDHSWQRWNTDRESILELLKKDNEWIIWGSGAVGEQFFAEAQNAKLYSVTKNQIVKEKGSFTGDTHKLPALIWAAGDEAAFPPSEVKVSKVFDLSYTERSRARIWAQEQKIAYESGLEFFVTQARKQQEHWR